MPAKPRSDTFDPHNVGVYHCWNKLVRGSYLFGADAVTGHGDSYRKDWMRDQFRELAAEDVLACCLYVNLNWIHAGMAETPEESRFTSAFDRIQARWREIGQEVGDSVSLSADHEADAWLAPILLDERAEGYVGPPPEQAADDQSEQAPTCNPPRAARISNKGFLPITRDQYLSARTRPPADRGCA